MTRGSWACGGCGELIPPGEQCPTCESPIRVLEAPTVLDLAMGPAVQRAMEWEASGLRLKALLESPDQLDNLGRLVARHPSLAEGRLPDRDDPPAEFHESCRDHKSGWLCPNCRAEDEAARAAEDEDPRPVVRLERSQVVELVALGTVAGCLAEDPRQRSRGVGLVAALGQGLDAVALEIMEEMQS